MDCVTECPDTAILGKVLVRRRMEREAADDSRSATARCIAQQWSQDQEILRRRQEEGHGDGGMFNIIIDPSKCKGCAECVTVCDDNALKMVDKTDEVMATAAQEPSLLQELRPLQRQVHQRQPADRHDAQGEDAHLRRRRRLVRRLRRRDRPAHDVLRHRLQVRRPVGHRRGHRLQHRLHLDLSVQPVPGSVDEFAVRKCAGRRHRRAHALGPDGLARQARSGASAATAPCSTSASSRSPDCSPAA